MSNSISPLESSTLEYIDKTRIKYSKNFIVTTVINHLSGVSIKIVTQRGFLRFLGCSVIRIRISEKSVNPNKAGLFEGIFPWGDFFWGEGRFDPPPPPSCFKKNLSNINITLYNC